MAAVLVAAVAAGGCSVPTSTTAERAATLAPHQDSRNGEDSLPRYLGLRTAFVIAGVDIDFKSSPQNPNRFTFQPRVAQTSSPNYGTTAAIDARGYFLTAAHVVRRGPVMLVLNDGKGVRAYPARLVWFGFDAPGHPDLALIHIDAPLSAAFSWSTDNRAGEAVFSSGVNYGDKDRPDFSFNVLAGTLEAVPAATTPEVPAKFVSRIPLHRGDSGGPLIDTRGGLIGVNSAFEFGFASILGWRGKLLGHSLRPHIGWV